MRDLLQPTTDAGNLAQLALAMGLWLVGLVWAWRRGREAQLVVVGLGIVVLGLIGLRGMH